jgi:hypothetical protein
MSAQPVSRSPQHGLRVLGLPMIAVLLVRLVLVVPDWVAGVAPVYPGQYERRLRGALTSVPLLSAVQLVLWSTPSAPSRRRVRLAWALLAMSVMAVLVDVVRG